MKHGILGLVVLVMTLFTVQKAEARRVVLNVSPYYASGYYYGRPYAHGYWGWGVGYPPIVYSPYYYGGYSYAPYYGYPNYPYAGYYPYPTYQPDPTYGAIVYSSTTDTVNYAYGYYSQGEATSAAQAGCGADCQPVVWVQGGCAALVTSAEKQQASWAYSSSKSHAKSTAVRGCRAKGATDCSVRAWVCSY